MTLAVVHTVVCVDDDPFVLAVVRKVLAYDGYHVLATEDPREALPLAAAEDADILLSDIRMPARSGLDLVVEARRRFPGLVRILLTSSTDFADALAALNDGEVFRFLTKPVDVSALRTTMAEASHRVEELRRAERERRARDRRSVEVALLEARHPGVTAVDGEGAVELPAERLRVLQGLAHGSAFARFLADPAGPDSSGEP